MGFLSRFEGKMEDTFEGAVDKMIDAPISPVQIAKKAEKQMRREKMVGAGKQYAPTLYTVLVNPDDDDRLFGYYPTLAGETETYLAAKAAEAGLVMDGNPLVRFVVDDDLKRGKFDIIAEAVAAPIVKQLRAEEMERYGIATPGGYASGGYDGGYDDYGAPSGRQPLPYVPEEEIDYSIDYGEYTFNSAEFDDYRDDRPEREQPYANAGAPNTAVFAGGAGQARPVSDGRGAGTPRARLIDTTNNRTYNLSSMRLLLGRETTNDIVVSDINASRTHAELRIEHGDTWVISDLGSTNGTYVNGRSVASHALADGDRITIGTTSFTFSLA